jgi:flagellar basal body-associated protein FliL
MTKEKEEKVKEEKPKEEKPREDKVRLLADAGREKKKSRSFLVFLIPMLLIGAAAGAYFFYGDAIMNGVVTRHLSKKGLSVSAEKETVGGPILTLEPFVFNLAGNTSKFAKVSLALGVRDGKVFEDSKRIVPVLRDKALTVLSAKSPEMLADVNNRESMKKELYESLKGLFKEQNDLQSVYITDIIIP